MNQPLSWLSSSAITDPLRSSLVLRDPSMGAGTEADLLRTRINDIIHPSPARDLLASNTEKATGEADSLALFERAAALKVQTANLAMHLDDNWRRKLFLQLDILLSEEEWDPEDNLPLVEAFRTFLRLVIFLKVQRSPGVGVSASGSVVLAWDHDVDRLTIDCLPNDRVRWVISRALDGDKETAAGQTVLPRLEKVLEPYYVSQWLSDGKAE